jgi:hypothetical protein
MIAFSPTRDWVEYRPIFERIAGSLSEVSSTPAIPVSPPLPSLSGGAAGGNGCSAGHWIESVEGDGKLIKLEDGSMWEVDDVDTVDTAIWLPVSNVVICGTKMINTDDSESAAVTHIVGSGKQSDAKKAQYTVDAAANDETFVISGKVFKAKTYCFGVEKGDRVIFIEGSALGACVSAKFLDFRNDKVCSVWCE